MSKNDNGGPAFPRPVSEDDQHYGNNREQYRAQEGMTLRDYFAGEVASGDASTEDGWGSDVTDELIAKRAALYYRVADAMLKAREA